MIVLALFRLCFFSSFFFYLLLNNEVQHPKIYCIVGVQSFCVCTVQ